MVELIDIYPSLCELSVIDPPDYAEGTSFVPLLSEPGRPWKKAVFSEIRGARTIRTNRYRLIKHKNGETELFDHENDPGENVNLANHPEYREIEKTLTQRLQKGWIAAKPD